MKGNKIKVKILNSLAAERASINKTKLLISIITANKKLKKFK